MNFEEKPISAGLYLVATPIGSARDITLRALDILASADLIAAEDTRTARKLMDIHAIPLRERLLIAFHDHSGTGAVGRIIADIANGRSVAYVSEAGTPLVSDPGFELARAAIAAGLPVIAAPGASAVLTALTVAGLPTDRFLFAGFLPASKAQREVEIAGLRDVAATLVFYESPRRLGEMLADLRDGMGGARQVAVARELTKRFEEVRRGTLAEMAETYADETVKGEVVVVVGRAGAEVVADDTVRAALQDAMRTMRIKDAATMVAGALGLPRRQVYQVALQLGDDDES